MTRTTAFAVLAVVLLIAERPIGAQGRGMSIAMPAMTTAPLEIFDVQPFTSAEPVLNAPFTAEAITEITQTLADGNRIERTLSSFIARDSRGRVRREEKIALMGPLAMQGNVPSIVTITDPEDGTVMLDSARKTATRFVMPNVKTLPLRKPLTGPNPSAGPDPAAGGDVVFYANGGPSLPVLPPGAGAIQGGAMFQMAIGGPDTPAEPIGTREIEGVQAEGTRSTFTIPARAIGNVNPIDVVTERWYSRELQMALVVARRDPRTGESTYRLTNIVRADPPADLFDVPSDYTILKRP